MEFMADLHPKMIKYDRIFLDQLSAIRSELTNMYLRSAVGDSVVQAARKTMENQIRKNETEAVAEFTDKEIGVDVWKQLAIPAPNYLFNNLVLKMDKIDRTKIGGELDDYVTNFRQGDLTVLSGQQPFSYEKQKELLTEAYDKRRPSFGTKQRLTDEEVWQPEGTYRFGKFWELLFAMKQEGLINIIDFGYEEAFVSNPSSVPGTLYIPQAKPLAFAWIEMLPQVDKSTLTKSRSLEYISADGGFKFEGDRLRDISTDQQPGKILKLLNDNLGELVKDEQFFSEVETADGRDNGFVLRNLKKALAKNRLKINVERRRGKGYILYSVEKIQPNP